MENNFTCTDCQHFFHEGAYSFVIREGAVFYKTKNGMHLKCPVCTSYNVKGVEHTGAYQATFSVFGSLSADEKKQALRKRSHEHSVKHLAERKDLLQKKFTGVLKEVKGL